MWLVSPQPGKLPADEACYQEELRKWVRDRGIRGLRRPQRHRLHQKLGGHHWVIEWSMAWPFGYHRRSIRYESYAHHFLTLICYGKLAMAIT